MTPDPNLDELLGVIGGVTEVLSETPKGAEIFEKLRKGELTTDEAVPQLLAIIQAEGLMPKMLEAQEQVTGITGYLGEFDLEKTGRPIFTETSTGIPQLNPVYEAALLERGSIDGDVPELRFGPLPEDGSPAVPVDTMAMSSVWVGWMLLSASDGVRRLIRDATEDHLAMRNRFLTEKEAEGMDEGAAITLANETLPAAPTGVEGYRAGETPALMVVAPPGILELDKITPSEGRSHAYRALATTQGRVSFIKPIRKHLAEELRSMGFEIEEGTANPNDKVTAQWTMRMWGADDISENFNFAWTAVRSLSGSLASSADPGDVWLLEVVPFNGVSDREFGWIAHMSPRSRHV